MDGSIALLVGSQLDPRSSLLSSRLLMAKC